MGVLLLRPAFAYSLSSFSYHQSHRNVNYDAKNTAFGIPVEMLWLIFLEDLQLLSMRCADDV